MMTEIIVTADILRSFVIPEETGQEAIICL